ncbi:MAG TPA: TIGR03617 family F420-dependent LLM class oxidoreductase [Anaerolineales bacterium]|jgi:probable F420-dependent oxidoreductase|nr:TIGR03617 family F420-dependent LLM class oxidoreductase [Anaerolineales bacterium]
MKFDATLPLIGLKNVPVIARAAEEVGFDALWTQETQHDPFLPCALIAEHTTRLHFGTGIAVSFARSPANIAYTAWDLAAQSDGRFILGLGTQVKAHIERRFGQPWPDSVTRKLREQIQVIRAFWDCWQNGMKLNYRGEYYKITLMSPFFNPGAIEYPIIPIYIAGVNTGLARLAGELCEGFHVHPLHSARYVREVLLPALEEGAKKTNRKREDISVSITAFVATTPEEINSARAQISFYASTPSYRPVMDLHGWASTAEKLSAHAARGEWAEMPMLITEEMLNEFCLTTEESTLADELKRRYAGIADRLTLYAPFIPEGKASWEKLIQHFKTS